MATIRQQRGELLESFHQGQPIPDEMPEGYSDKHVDTIDDIGQPITACFLKQTNIDPTNWYASEKVLLAILNQPSPGGCLRNMTVYGASGIL